MPRLNNQRGAARRSVLRQTAHPPPSAVSALPRRYGEGQVVGGLQARKLKMLTFGWDLEYSVPNLIDEDNEDDVVWKNMLTT